MQTHEIKRKKHIPQLAAGCGLVRKRTGIKPYDVVAIVTARIMNGFRFSIGVWLIAVAVAQFILQPVQ